MIFMAGGSARAARPRGRRTALVAGGGLHAAQLSGRVAGCLRKNEAQLSASCKQRVAQVREQLKEVDQACEDDIHAFCPGIQQGGGRIAACLKQNQAKVSAGCKAKVAEVMPKK